VQIDRRDRIARVASVSASCLPARAHVQTDADRTAACGLSASVEGRRRGLLQAKRDSAAPTYNASAAEAAAFSHRASQVRALT